MLKIRLAQYGSRNRRTYRIVAIEEGKRRNGTPVEILGFYNPLVKPAQFSVDTQRLNYWKSQGAQITPGVKKLLP
ncbi:MAG TPA: 30S ribosomal protein S16 [Patescibacteria group bacterium]|nr:30S ribosomal protein S16 [Patescibacteria group bacterium]